jgi:hypothetical protein
MVFFMLRDAIGEDAFGRGVRAFWEENKFHVAGWNDLQRAFERASARGLDVFFEQWVRRAGAPAIAIAEARARSARGVTTLALTLVQTAPAYALDVPIEIRTNGRTDVRRASISRERQTVEFQLSYVPESVRLDPDLRIWRVLDRDTLPPILREWIGARTPRLYITSANPEVRKAAESVANALFESRSTAVGPSAFAGSTEPILLIGMRDEVDAALAAAALPERPRVVANRGSAEVWTIRRRADAPVAVVSARDAASLAALARPLPHYGGQSWLVFEGARAMDRGVWPVSVPSVRVARD